MIMLHDRAIDRSRADRASNQSFLSLSSLLAAQGSVKWVTEPETRHLIDTITALIRNR
jgi:hypothetical protein